MEICYAGALVMPSSYAMLDEEEMMYVEGGAKKLITTISATNCNRLASMAAIAGGLVTALCGLVTVVSAVATLLDCGITAAAVAIAGGITCAAGGLTAAVSGYLSLASTYKGLNIYYNTITLNISCSIKK